VIDVTSPDHAKPAPVGLHPEVLRRYGRWRRRRHHKEYRFRLMGDLEGRRVVDVGCGEGTDALVMAALGADVVGLDASGAALARAASRPVPAGWHGRVRWLEARLGDDALPAAAFDVVWADQFLSVTPAESAALLPHMMRLVAPGGVMVLAERVSLSPALRRLPRSLGVSRDGAGSHAHALGPEQLRHLVEAMDSPDVRFFRLLARLDQHLFPPLPYEGGPGWFRGLVDGVASVDYALLSLPPLAHLGAMVTVVGRPATSGRLTSGSAVSTPAQAPR